jgi:hypothetical protein
VFTFATRLPPKEWLDAWRQGSSRLMLPSPNPPRLHEKVAARVQIAGQPACATLFGKAVSVQRLEQHFRVEMALETESLRGLRLLNAAARGEPIRFLERSLRYIVKLPVIVPWRGGQVYTTTVSISEGGCALRWSGALPSTGERLTLRVGAGSRSLDYRGVVCWADGSLSTAGVRVFTGGLLRDAWKNLLADAARSGAAAA